MFFVANFPGRQRTSTFGYRDVGLVGRHAKAQMQIFFDLLANRGHDRSATMPIFAQPMPPAKSMKAVAVHVFQNRALDFGPQKWASNDTARRGIAASRRAIKGAGTRPGNFGSKLNGAHVLSFEAS